MSATTGQLHFLRADVARVVHWRWWRWAVVAFHPGMLSIAGYRLSRAAYLRLGPWWPILRTILAPGRMLLRPFSAGLEIHYKAEIGPGLLILHPTLGVVVSANAAIGRNLVLVGGNCIGGRSGVTSRSIAIGDDVTLGVNAVVLGPCTLGDGVVVGAGSVLIADAPTGATMVGSPARAAGRLGGARSMPCTT